MTTSSAVVGSSAITSDGPAGERQGDHHPLALAAGELVRVAVPERRASARRWSAARRSARARSSRADPLVQPDRLGDLGVDPLHRVERVHRALEDQRDVAPAHQPHAALGPPLDVDRLVAPGGRRVIFPDCLRAGGSSFITDSAVVVLPQPGLAREPERLARARASGRPRRRSGRPPWVTRRSLTSSSALIRACSRSRGLTYSSNR